jgi:putative heme-binding domain-containing protein
MVSIDKTNKHAVYMFAFVQRSAIRKRSTLGVVLAIVWTGGGVIAQQNAALDQPVQYAPADIAFGAGLYSGQCVTCHGSTGDAVGGVNLRGGKFRRATTVRDLTTIITTGIPGTAMPGFKFNTTEVDGLIAYLRNMNSFDLGSVKPGDAQHGKAIFEGKGACLTCHRVNGKGSYVGPNLSDIGSVRGAGALERSLIDPTSGLMPINRPVRAVKKDGTVINGRRLNEDTYSVQLMDTNGRLVSLMKADLRDYRISTTASMPSYRRELEPTELADVMAYLLSLKGF